MKGWKAWAVLLGAAGVLYSCGSGSPGDLDSVPGELTVEALSDVIVPLDALDAFEGEDRVPMQDVGNRPPRIDTLPGVTVKMGHTVDVDLAGYYGDPDDKKEDLTLSWEARHVAIAHQGGGVLRLVGPVDWSGVELVRITVTDAGGLSDTEQMAVTVEYVEAPLPTDMVSEVWTDVVTTEVAEVEDAVDAFEEEVSKPCGWVEFVYTGTVNYQAVVAGSFNGWSTTDWEMAEEEGTGVWKYDVVLEPGQYPYKFVIDGVWITDPLNPKLVDDGFGGQNNVLDVPPC